MYRNDGAGARVQKSTVDRLEIGRCRSRRGDGATPSDECLRNVGRRDVDSFKAFPAPDDNGEWNDRQFVRGGEFGREIGRRVGDYGDTGHAGTVSDRRPRRAINATPRDAINATPRRSINATPGRGSTRRVRGHSTTWPPASAVETLGVRSRFADASGGAAVRSDATDSPDTTPTLYVCRAQPA